MLPIIFKHAAIPYADFAHENKKELGVDSCLTHPTRFVAIQARTFFRGKTPDKLCHKPMYY